MVVRSNIRLLSDFYLTYFGVGAMGSGSTYWVVDRVRLI